MKPLLIEAGRALSLIAAALFAVLIAYCATR